MSGTGAKLIDRTSAATRTTDRIPPRLSTGSLASLTWLGTYSHGRHDRDRGERQGDQEDRAPPEVLQQRAGEHGAERGDGAADARPQGDRLRAPGARPERRDQGERRRERHAGGKPAQEARQEEDLVRRRPGCEQARRNRQRHAEDQHQLAPVAIADRAEVEHRCGEAQGVADRDQIERRLARVELLGDRRQGDVRNREVQVRNRRHEDQRAEDERGTLGGARGRIVIGRFSYATNRS